jgi:DegV family protein with EDD domain
MGVGEVDAGKVAVITDSNICLPPEVLKEYRIGIVPILIIMGEEVLRDGVDITTKELYAHLRSSEVLPTTSSPSPAQYQEAFEAAEKTGAESAVVVTLSSKLSMAYSTATLASQAMPRFPVRVVDSRMATTAQGFVALAAARAAARGMDLEQVAAAAQRSITRSGFVAVLDTLTYLHRGGRVPVIASLAGQMLSLRPVLKNQDDGSVGIAGIVRSKKKVAERLVRLVQRLTVGRRVTSLAVMHADAWEEAVELQAVAAQDFSEVDVFTVEFSPVMGVHAGPGALGLAYQADAPGG